MILLGAASMRLRRRAASEAALETTLALRALDLRFALARAETKVDEEQQARRLVADASDALVLEVDQRRPRPLVLPAVEQLLGYTADELVGIEVYSLLHPDDLLSPANGPQRYAHKDGTLRRARRPPAHAPRRARVRRRRRHGPARPGGL